MLALVLADLLPDSSLYYGLLIGVGLLLGVYAHAARMPRLVAFSIMLVFLATLLTMVAARSTGGGGGGVPLP